MSALSMANTELARRTDRSLPSQTHRLRRHQELEWASVNGWSSELLFAHDAAVAWQQEGGIIGPPLGSTGSSLLLWILGLSPFDPVAWELPPSVFYRGGLDPKGRCRWHGWSDSGHKHPRFLEDEGLKSGPVSPLAPADTTSFAAAKSVITQWQNQATSQDANMSEMGASSFPEATNILARQHDRGFYDLLCAIALSRPGPARSGMIEAYLNADNSTDLPPIFAISKGVIAFREQLHWLAQKVLKLNIDDANAFVQQVQRDPQGQWRVQLEAALNAEGHFGEWAQTLCERIGAFSPYLYPLSQALSQTLIACQHQEKNP